VLEAPAAQGVLEELAAQGEPAAQGVLEELAARVAQGEPAAASQRSIRTATAGP
jgi:hypothetical protein